MPSIQERAVPLKPPIGCLRPDHSLHSMWPTHHIRKYPLRCHQQRVIGEGKARWSKERDSCQEPEKILLTEHMDSIFFTNRWFLFASSFPNSAKISNTSDETWAAVWCNGESRSLGFEWFHIKLPSCHFLTLTIWQFLTSSVSLSVKWEYNPSLLLFYENLINMLRSLSISYSVKCACYYYYY